jgi:hypothetical protein
MVAICPSVGHLRGRHDIQLLAETGEVLPLLSAAGEGRCRCLKRCPVLQVRPPGFGKRVFHGVELAAVYRRFNAAAGEAMRRSLVAHTRQQRAGKRGKNFHRAAIDSDELPGRPADPDGLMPVDEALGCNPERPRDDLAGRRPGLGDLFRRALRDQPAAFLTRARPQVDDPVGRDHDFRAMLDDD